jgi:hypothetical protein
MPVIKKKKNTTDAISIEKTLDFEIKPIFSGKPDDA